MPRKKQQKTEQGAPAWMVTYGDAMTLLLCFFVIIVSMSELKEERKFQQFVESFRVTFGGEPGNMLTIPTDLPITNSLIKQLRELEPMTHTESPSISDDVGVQGRKLRVTNVRDGVEVIIGGTISYDRFSATLLPEARELIAGTASIVRGYNTVILIRGHATHERLPEDSLFRDQRDLSYERARSVAIELERNGVRRSRLVLVAMGDTQPVRKQAYSADRRSDNRRVEILVTEDLLEEYQGTNLHEELEEGRDDR